MSRRRLAERNSRTISDNWNNRMDHSDCFRGKCRQKLTDCSIFALSKAATTETCAPHR